MSEEDEDPALTGPLGLSDDITSEDMDFLQKVDSKLEEAARQKQNSSGSHNGKGSESDPFEDPPEHEPPLRI